MARREMVDDNRPDLCSADGSFHLDVAEGNSDAGGLSSGTESVVCGRRKLSAGIFGNGRSFFVCGCEPPGILGGGLVAGAQMAVAAGRSTGEARVFDPGGSAQGR